MHHTHDSASGATPLPASLLADAGPGSGRAPRRETARLASRDYRDPWTGLGAEREPRGAVEAYYAQPTLRHAPSFY